MIVPPPKIVIPSATHKPLFGDQNGGKVVVEEVPESQLVKMGVKEIIERRVKVVQNYRDRVNMILSSPLNLAEVREVMFQEF